MQTGGCFSGDSMHNSSLSREQQVIEVLDLVIRPLLRVDDGDLELVSVVEGVVTITFLGACSGCPLAGFTLKVLVEQELKTRLPWVERVTLSL